MLDIDLLLFDVAKAFWNAKLEGDVDTKWEEMVAPVYQEIPRLLLPLFEQLRELNKLRIRNERRL
jgi:hypothetical protein